MATDPHLEPHWDSAALITIDMQRDFLSDGPFGLAGTTEVLPNLTKLTEAFRATGRPIVHVVRTRLEELLAAHNVDTLVFAGCNLPNCPRASIIEAHERDYRVVLVTDAVSQASDQGFREIADLGTVLCTTAAAITPMA